MTRYEANRDLPSAGHRSAYRSRRASRFAIAACLLLSIGGCYVAPTPEQRTRSLAEANLPENQRDQVIETILQRTVYLETWHKNGAKSKATGVILTNDGYLLTAAHCVGPGHQLPFIAFPEDRQLLVLMPVRLVWRGDEKSGADLALIKIDRDRLIPFEWATDEHTRPNTRILGAGSNQFSDSAYLTPAAGYIRKTIDKTANPPLKAIHVNAPIGKGDSGGPWVDPEGRLLGIAVGGFREVRLGIDGASSSQIGVLLRPNAQWLAALIDEDRRTHPTTQPAPTLMTIRRMQSPAEIARGAK